MFLCERPGTPLGTRTETKNLNSLRFIQMAIDHEVSRQIEIIEDGGKVDQETRLFDTSTGATRTMRSKEDAHDYRYFPDPDLLPLFVTQDEVCRLKLIYLSCWTTFAIGLLVIMVYPLMMRQSLLKSAKRHFITRRLAMDRDRKLVAIG